MKLVSRCSTSFVRVLCILERREQVANNDDATGVIGTTSRDSHVGHAS